MANEDQTPRMDEMFAILGRHNPYVQKLARQRFYAPKRSGLQLYNSNTHQLRNGILDKAQAIEVLLLVKELARVMNVQNFWFSKDEQKLLGLFDSEDVK